MGTAKTLKETVEHKDRLGQPLLLGDCVAYPSHNSLEIGVIKKLNAKMLRVVPARADRYRGDGSLKYPSDLIKLQGPEVTMYMLKLAAQA